MKNKNKTDRNDKDSLTLESRILTADKNIEEELSWNEDEIERSKSSTRNVKAL